MKAVIVTIPFADYAKGEQITDGEIVDRILAGHNAHHVVQVTLSDAVKSEDAPHPLMASAVNE